MGLFYKVHACFMLNAFGPLKREIASENDVIIEMQKEFRCAFFVDIFQMPSINFNVFFYCCSQLQKPIHNNEFSSKSAKLQLNYHFN